MTFKGFPVGRALPAASGVARPTRCGDSVFKYVILKNYQPSGNLTFHPVCIDYYRSYSIICSYLASLPRVKGTKPTASKKTMAEGLAEYITCKLWEITCRLIECIAWH